MGNELAMNISGEAKLMYNVTWITAITKLINLLKCALRSMHSVCTNVNLWESEQGIHVNIDYANATKPFITL